MRSDKKMKGVFFALNNSVEEQNPWSRLHEYILNHVGLLLSYGGLFWRGGGGGGGDMIFDAVYYSVYNRKY